MDYDEAMSNLIIWLISSNKLPFQRKINQVA